ncbi:MAG: dihydropteroate synthase [Bacteroidetes bacterium]|nr:dihydropteroate synthase [Bacteroidota bacterium]
MHDPKKIIKFRQNTLTERLFCREHWLDLSHGSIVMGILNITPDSFYDGGKYKTISQALKHSDQMLADGARIIDVGGASSRPSGHVYGAGADPVPENEEIRRVIPVVKAIRKSMPEAVISVDTFSPVVAKAALDSGAHMINDILGMQNGTLSAQYASDVGAAYVVMHSVELAGKLFQTSEYQDVVNQVCGMLNLVAKQAKELGVKSVIIDPGFGFGKHHQDNLKLIQQLNVITELGYPILVGISRKSTVGQVLSDDDVLAPVEDRLYGSLGMTAIAVCQGAQIIRTHDVRETVQMIKAIEAVIGV